MPRTQTTPLEEIIRFVMLARSGRFSVIDLCEQSGISRKSGHMHLARYAEVGLSGLQPRSCRPQHSPQRTPGAVRALRLAERRRRSGAFVPGNDGLTHPTQPNHVWTVDFKGWSVLGDGRRCDSLTVCDRYSRYVPACDARPTSNTAAHCTRFAA